MDKAPVVELSNELKVLNFSSPHPFNFEDGTTLPACSAERALSLMLKTEERESLSPCLRWTDVDLEFKMSESVRSELVVCCYEQVDIVIVPLPVLQIARKIKLPHRHALVIQRKVRGIRVKNRATKEIFIDRFCL